MQIHVGSVIKFREQDWLCTAIHRQTCSSFARVSSEILKAERGRISNVQHMSLEIEEFAENDIICTETEWVELSIPGQNLFFIYTKFNVKKETLDGREGSKTTADQGADNPLEAVGQEHQGSQGTGAESAGEDSAALHRDG